MKNIIIILAILTFPFFIKGNQSTQQEIKLVSTDTINNVNNKWALFIGDSHTSNHEFGWHVLLCDRTGIRMNNISEKGKTTGWMLEQAKFYVHEGFDYCFIYGGANDMYGKVTPRKAMKNVQSIVNICIVRKVKAVVITGFNPLVCVRTPNNPGYPHRYAEFQQMLLDSIKGAKVIDTRGAVIRKDCWDDICHMNAAGHKKMAETIINKMKLKIK